MKRVVFVSILVLFMGVSICQATMTTLSFTHITNNNPINITIAEAQLFVDVVDLGGSNVDFVFRNIGPAASSISEIYMDDGSLLALAQIIDNPPAVDFVSGAIPANLPGGENINPAFVATEVFSAEADNPSSKKGINPNEQLTLRYTLQGGQIYQNVIDELTTGDLRIGLHVTSFALGSSESLVNHPAPEPATISMLGLGVLGLLRKRRA